MRLELQEPHRHHMEVNEGPRMGKAESELYSDWSEDTTWVLCGVWGNGVGRTSFETSRRFIDVDSASRFYAAAYGEPVERRFWAQPENQGGRWGLRFRGSKPPTIVQAPSVGEACNTSL